MGWDNKVVILVENSKNEHLAIANEIFQKDSKEYSQAECLYKEASNGTLYYCYERRKYVPYWIIQEISESYPLCLFTLLGDCPDFLSGPGGIVRIKSGIIVDSYGFIGARQDLVEDHHPEKVFEWFRFGGPEEILRDTVIESFPKKWCDEQFSGNLIPLDDPKELIKINQEIYGDFNEYGWSKLPGPTD